MSKFFLVETDEKTGKRKFIEVPEEKVRIENNETKEDSKDDPDKKE